MTLSWCLEILKSENRHFAEWRFSLFFTMIVMVRLRICKVIRMAIHLLSEMSESRKPPTVHYVSLARQGMDMISHSENSVNNCIPCSVRRMLFSKKYGFCDGFAV